MRRSNTVVGDLDGNRARDPRAARRGARAGADLVLFPELAVTGYPPEDLLLRPGFVRAASGRSSEIAARDARHRRARRLAPLRRRPLQRLRRLRGRRGPRRSTASASCPTTASSTRTATSRPGRDLVLLRLGDALVGPTICEDIWQPGPPATDLALAGAELLVNISASPFHVGKERRARGDVRHSARATTRASSRFCNAVGGQDELIFDGHSRRPRRRGRGARARARLRGGAARRRRRPARRRSGGGCATCAAARSRASGEASCRSSRVVERPRSTARRTLGRAADRAASSTSSSRCGSRSSSACATTCEKNGFGDVVLGLSGGIDSALTAALAAEALGPERVHCVSMPSRYSSEATRGGRAAARREPRLRLPRAPDRAGRRGVRRSARAAPSPGASPT